MRPSRASGFTLLEVMIALAILSVSLVAIIGINGGTVSAHTYAKQVSVATMLARSKMADLESEFTRDGFTSEFDQTMEGDFSEDGWDTYRWKAEIVKPDLDAANATGMVQQLVAQFMGETKDDVDAVKGSATAAPVPQLPQLDPAMMAPMIESQVTRLTETLEKAVREVRLTVTWEDGANTESLQVVTHMVVLAPAGQPGGEPNDPEAVAVAMSGGQAGQSVGSGVGGPGGPGGALGPGGSNLFGGGGTGLPGQPGAGGFPPLPPGMAPGPMPGTGIAPNGQMTGPGIPRPEWVPPGIPAPPYGARYNPGIRSNPGAPPFIWDVPVR